MSGARTRPGALPALLLVLLGHGLLYLLLDRAHRPAAPPAPARLVTLRWIAPPPAAAAATRPAPAAPRTAPARADRKSVV